MQNQDDGQGCLLSAAVALIGSALAMIAGWFMLLYLLGKKWSELE